MVRDILVVSGVLVVVAVSCALVFQFYQIQPHTIVPGGTSGGNGDLVRGKDVKDRREDVSRPPKKPDVRFFTTLKNYTEWFVNEAVEMNVEPRPPETIDFSNNSVMLVQWGDKPTEGFNINVKSIYSDESAVNVLVETTAPKNDAATTATCPAVTVVVPCGRRVKLVIVGDRFSSANTIYADFHPKTTLEYELTIPTSTPR